WGNIVGFPAGVGRPTPSYRTPRPRQPGLRRAVVLEPRPQTLPALLRRFLAVGRPVGGVEAVGCIREYDDLARLLGLFESGPHLLDRIRRDARVGAAVQPEDRGLQV